MASLPLDCFEKCTKVSSEAAASPLQECTGTPDMDSGTLAEFDEDGISSVGGRTKDMIIQGGENNFPREVEERLICHPKVSDAQACGIPVEKLGEPDYAWIVAKPGTEVAEAELRETQKGQIAHFKVPAHIRFVDELPMTVTGKPQNFVTRERIMEMLEAHARTS